MRATWFLVPQLSVAFLLEEKDASINELKEPPTLISIDAKESPTLSAGGAMESAMKSAKDVQAMSPATVPMAFVEKVQANEGNGGPAPVGPAAEDPVPVESEYLNGYGYGHGGPAPVGPAAEEKMVNKDRDIVERFAQEKADEWGRHWLENVLPLKLEDDGSNWATIQRAVKLIYEQERVLTDFWRQQVNLDEDLNANAVPAINKSLTKRKKDTSEALFRALTTAQTESDTGKHTILGEGKLLFTLWMAKAVAPLVAGMLIADFKKWSEPNKGVLVRMVVSNKTGESYHASAHRKITSVEGSPDPVMRVKDMRENVKANRGSLEAQILQPLLEALENHADDKERKEIIALLILIWNALLGGQGTAATRLATVLPKLKERMDKKRESRRQALEKSKAKKSQKLNYGDDGDEDGGENGTSKNENAKSNSQVVISLDGHAEGILHPFLHGIAGLELYIGCGKRVVIILESPAFNFDCSQFSKWLNLMQAMQTMKLPRTICFEGLAVLLLENIVESSALIGVNASHGARSGLTRIRMQRKPLAHFIENPMGGLSTLSVASVAAPAESQSQTQSQQEAQAVPTVNAGGQEEPVTVPGAGLRIINKHDKSSGHGGIAPRPRPERTGETPASQRATPSVKKAKPHPAPPDNYLQKGSADLATGFRGDDNQDKDPDAMDVDEPNANSTVVSSTDARPNRNSGSVAASKNSAEATKNANNTATEFDHVRERESVEEAFNRTFKHINVENCGELEAHIPNGLQILNTTWNARARQLVQQSRRGADKRLPIEDKDLPDLPSHLLLLETFICAAGCLAALHRAGLAKADAGKCKPSPQFLSYHIELKNLQPIAKRVTAAMERQRLQSNSQSVLDPLESSQGKSSHGVMGINQAERRTKKSVLGLYYEMVQAVEEIAQAIFLYTNPEVLEDEGEFRNMPER